MNTPDKCFLTDLPATFKQPDNAKRTWIVDSPACGMYEISHDGAKIIPQKYPGSLYILAAIARRHSDEGKRLELHTGNVQNLLDAVDVPSRPLEKIDEIVKYIHKKTPHFGAKVRISHTTDYPVVFARNESEFVSLLYEAQEMDYIQVALIQQQGKYFLNYNCNLAREGYQRIDELRRTGRDSNKAFVAMSFNKDDPTLMDAWQEGIKPALDETGWKPIRMDLLEHNKKIDDQMIAEIRRSGLLVADLTGNRQNVYFEAGFAMGLGIPVIYTCSNKETIKHFDTRQYKYIAWTDGADLCQKLRERIEATGLAKTLRENTGEN